MADIKLYVCCHQPLRVPEHPLLVPIQVGAALADTHFPGFLYDDTGDNISFKNRSYCELTAQYWAWKNAKADYYGFFHYRRYLYPDTHTKKPYRIEREPTSECLNRMAYDSFPELIQGYDLILPKGENMYTSVREHYADAPFHHRKDLELAEEIVRKLHPKYELALDDYLSGTICYFGNIYIMNRPMFEEYCAWLFPILGEFDRQADIAGYGPQELRVDGYLAERLLGVYVAYQKACGGYHILELPRVHFHAGMDGVSRRLLNGIFPPGSRWRSLAKQLKRRGS